MPRRALYTIVLVTALFFAGSASAGPRIDATVSIHLPPDTSAAYFYGAVSSQRRACERSRTLKIVRDPTGTAGYHIYATDITSNPDGTWTYHSMPNPVVNGYYRAVALRKKTHSGVVCLKAKSKPFFVD